MPIAQVRNASMQQLNSADLLSVKDRNFGAEWVDGAGGATFTAATTVPLATERINPAPELFVMNSNILTITEAGLFLFHFAVTASHSGSGELVFQITLEEDPDTGSFAEIPGTIAYATFFNGFGTAVNSALVRTQADYRYRLRVASLSGGTNSLVQNGSKLSVVRLYGLG